MLSPSCVCSSFFFFNDTATTEIYTLSLHDALPILLKPYGVSIASDMVYDLASNVQVGIPAQFGQVLAPYPFWLRALSTKASPVNADLEAVLLPWASRIDKIGRASCRERV